MTMFDDFTSISWEIRDTYAPNCCLDELKSNLVLIRGVDKEDGFIGERRDAGLAAPLVAMHVGSYFRQSQHPLQTISSKAALTFHKH
jgi:hypothetical protein